MIANAELLARRTNAVPRGVATATPVFAARALNAELWDVEGNRYVDFAGGIAVLNVGHRNPRVMAAVTAQLECYTHTAFQVIAYEPYIELAEKLNALAPFSGPAKTIFFCTGGEAVENAVKIARAATGRSGDPGMLQVLPTVVRDHPGRVPIGAKQHRSGCGVVRAIERVYRNGRCRPWVTTRRYP